MQWKSCDHQLFHVWDTQNSAPIQEMPPEIITQCCLPVCSVNTTELLLFVKRRFISVGNDSGNIVDFRPLHAGAALFATQWIFMPQSPPSWKIHTLCCVFISLGSWETMLIKTYLCLTEQRRIWYSLRKDYDICDTGAWAPDCSMPPCSLSCSVLIFFWNCL